MKKTNKKKIDEKLNKEMNFGKHSIKNKQRKKIEIAERGDSVAFPRNMFSKAI
jgi:hypothetical protein